MDRKIIEDLKNGHFEITVHAAMRMNEREVKKEDLMEVICDYIDETLIVTVLTKEELL